MTCRAASTDIPDPLSTLLPITHRLLGIAGIVETKLQDTFSFEILYMDAQFLSDQHIAHLCTDTR